MTAKEQHFESLYADYAGMVRTLCRGYARGDEALAADLTQETFLQVWRYLDRFAGEASAKTWVYRIAVNTCLGEVRRQRSRPDTRGGAPPETTAAPPTEPSVDPSADAGRDAPRYRALYRALGELAEVDRLVLILQLEGLDYGEIAGVVGLDRGHVRVRAHRARQRLRTLLQARRTPAR